MWDIVLSFFFLLLRRFNSHFWCVLVFSEAADVTLRRCFLRASAHGAERVYSSYRQNQRDEGVGSVCNFPENFVKFDIWINLQVS